jgi:hypothetical protein
MKNILLMLSLILWAGCTNSEKEVLGDVTEMRAMVVNNLAVDGCDWHIELTSVDSSRVETVVPTQASESKVKAAVPKYKTEDAYSFTAVNIKYRRVNTKRKLTCGFGHVSEVDEIEVLQISRIE